MIDVPRTCSVEVMHASLQFLHVILVSFERKNLSDSFIRHLLRNRSWNNNTTTPVPMDHISMALEHGSTWHCQMLSTALLENLLSFRLSTDRFQISPPGPMDRAIICPTAKYFGCSIPPSANIPARMKGAGIRVLVTSCSSHRIPLYFMLISYINASEGVDSCKDSASSAVFEMK